MEPVDIVDLGLKQRKKKGVIREILDNYRDIALYKRAMVDICLCLNGHDIPIQDYEDDTVNCIFCLIEDLKRKAEKLQNLKNCKNTRALSIVLCKL